MSTPVLGLFAKAPLAGHAKTRLGAEIGMERAARIYEEMLRSLLSRFAQGLSGWRRIVFVASAEGQHWFEDNAPGWELRRQAEGDLGDRLAEGFTALFAEGAGQVIIIGADAPELQVSHLEAAAAALERSGLVLGPAHDGGYYLIGQQAPGADLFSEMPWSSEHLLERTLRRAEEHQLAAELLSPLHDVDDGDDWRRLNSRLPG